MRFHKTAGLFLESMGASLFALLGLLFLSSSALAFTWDEINQKLQSCLALSQEAATLLGGVDDSKVLRDRAEKIEENLGRVIEIYQALVKADLPQDKISKPNSTEIKSSLSENLGRAEQCLKVTQILKEVLEENLRRKSKVPAGFKAGTIIVDLTVDLNSLSYRTSFLQSRLKGIIAGSKTYQRKR